jgi:membrane associated rhomboid family serine protease
MGFSHLTDVVKNILIINIIMFLGAGAFMEFIGSNRLMLALHYFESPYFRPYQVVTHIFMHSNQGITHILFNMFAVFMFGPILEATWGARRFLSYYLITAFGAAALHTLVNYVSYHHFGGSEPVPMLGASGAVFGLLLGFGVYYPNNVIQLLIPPIPIKAKYFVMIYAGIELYLGIGQYDTGVAHFAHLGGALTGLIVIWFWRMKR